MKQASHPGQFPLVIKLFFCSSWVASTRRLFVLPSLLMIVYKNWKTFLNKLITNTWIAFTCHQIVYIPRVPTSCWGFGNFRQIRMGNRLARNRLKAQDFHYIAKNTAFLTNDVRKRAMCAAAISRVQYIWIDLLHFKSLNKFQPRSSHFRFHHHELKYKYLLLFSLIRIWISIKSILNFKSNLNIMINTTISLNSAKWARF